MDNDLIHLVLNDDQLMRALYDMDLYGGYGNNAFYHKEIYELRRSYIIEIIRFVNDEKILIV